MDLIWFTIVWVGGRNAANRCVVINYHEVKASDRDTFGHQMDTILRWANPIEVGTEVPGGKPCRYFAITFDDAFACILDSAVPELLKRRVPFGVFVPTAHIGKAPGWIKQRPNKSGSSSVMTEEQIKWLKKSGIVAIGSHCMTHANLLTLTAKQARAEIEESKQRLQDLVGGEISLFSFPYGAFDPSHVKMAIAAKYSRAFSILPEPYTTNHSPFVVGRVRIDPEDWTLELVLKICGAYRWLPYAFRLKRKIMSWSKMMTRRP